MGTVLEFRPAMAAEEKKKPRAKKTTRKKTAQPELPKPRAQRAVTPPKCTLGEEGCDGERIHDWRRVRASGVAADLNLCAGHRQRLQEA